MLKESKKSLAFSAEKSREKSSLLIKLMSLVLIGALKAVVSASLNPLIPPPALLNDCFICVPHSEKLRLLKPIL